MKGYVKRNGFIANTEPKVKEIWIQGVFHKQDDFTEYLFYRIHS